MWAAILILPCLLVLSTIYHRLKRHAAFRAFALSENCGEPTWIRKPFPWGLDRVYRILTFRGDIIDDVVGQKYAKWGNTHARQRPWGSITISTIDPENIQAVLSKQFRQFEFGASRKRVLDLPVGRGIINSDGAEWVHSRGMMKAAFRRPRTKDLRSGAKHVESLLEAIGLTDEDGFTKLIDLKDLLYRFTLDVSSEFLFGISVGAQLSSSGRNEHQMNEELQEFFKLERQGFCPEQNTGFERQFTFTKAFDMVLGMVAFRFRAGSFYWLGDGFAYRKAVSYLHKFTDRYFDLAVSAIQENRLDRSKDTVLIDTLMSGTSSKSEFRSQAIHLLVAGRDPTAATLSWTFAELFRHPNEYQRLVKEVRDMFGSRDRQGRMELSADNLNSCEYLQWVIKETMRLHPVGPLSTKVALQDTTLPVGGGKDGRQPIAIPASTPVNWSLYFLHRRKDIWGHDAELWRPERWEGRKTGWEYLPFSGGPRLCIGHHYAMNLASLVIARLLQTYDGFETALPAEKIGKKSNSIILAPENDGLRVKLKSSKEGV